MGGPELQLRVARCPYVDEELLAAIVKLDSRHGLRVTTIERFGEPQNRREGANDPSRLRAKRAKIGVRLLWSRLAVVPGDEGDNFRFQRLEPAQIAVLDEVIGMLVMTRIADVRPDVVQQRRELEPLPLAV